MDNNQKISNITQNLGFPLTLGVEPSVSKNLKGGMLSDKFIIEAGLSVVPLSLLALNEFTKIDNTKKKEIKDTSK